MKERKEYLDIAKGIMMLIVVLHHLPQVAKNVTWIGKEYFETINGTSALYSCFIMPGFFLVTGYCSNFEKPIKTFVLQNFKSLIILGLLYGIVNETLSNILVKNDFSITIDFIKIGKTLLYDGTKYWFLPALFLAKMGYFFLSKLKIRNEYIFLLSIILLIIMVYVFDRYHELVAIDEHHFKNEVNHWSIFHAIYLFPFICIGKEFKKRNLLNTKLLTALSCIYILAILLHYTVDFRIPALTYYIGVISYLDIIKYLILATCGTALILNISMFIHKNDFLRVIGTNTMKIYTTHFTMLRFVEGIIMYNILISASMPRTLLITATTFIAVVAIYYSVFKLYELYGKK